MDAKKIAFQARGITDPEARLVFVDGACQGDQGKQARVNALLRKIISRIENVFDRQEH